MPDSIIKRAEEILLTYENNKEVKHHNVGEQITFDFKEKKDPIKEELDKIDILKITPIDALNILYKLKNMK